MTTAISEAIGRLIKRSGSVRGVIAELEKESAREEAEKLEAERARLVARRAELAEERAEKLPALREAQRRAVQEWNAWNDRGRLAEDNRLREASRAATKAVEGAEVALSDAGIRERLRATCPFAGIIDAFRAEMEAVQQEAVAASYSRDTVLARDSGDFAGQRPTKYESARPSAEVRRIAAQKAAAAADDLRLQALSMHEAEAELRKLRATVPPLKTETFKWDAEKKQHVKVA